MDYWPQLVRVAQAHHHTQEAQPDNTLTTFLLLIIFFLLLVIVIILVGGLYWYFRLKDNKKGVITEAQSTEPLKTDEEILESHPPAASDIRDLESLRVLKMLRRNGGQMLQSEIPSETGLSKSTISRLLTELEKRKLVEREPYKRSFLIKLAEANSD
ncbi:MAG: helix-turn-helix transcriptional regulator [Candidatus Hodarchaeales archaeon]|jgi:uncharacterized membrane protein